MTELTHLLIQTIPFNLAHIATTLVCAIILFGLAKNLPKARYLKFLGAAWAFNSMFYVFETLNLIVEQILHSYENKPTGEILESLRTMYGMFDSLLSFWASICLFVAAYLLTKYPEEEFPAMQMVVAISVATIAFVGLTLAAPAVKAVARYGLLTIDVTTATLGAIVVGNCLYKLKGVGPVHWLLPPFRTFGRIVFWIWGLLQLPYPVYVLWNDQIIQIPNFVADLISSPTSPYFLCLLLIKVICAASAGVISLLALRGSTSAL